MLLLVLFLLKKSLTHRCKAWRQVGQCPQACKEAHQRSRSSFQWCTHADVLTWSQRPQNYSWAFNNSSRTCQVGWVNYSPVLNKYFGLWASEWWLLCLAEGLPHDPLCFTVSLGQAWFKWTSVHFGHPYNYIYELMSRGASVCVKQESLVFVTDSNGTFALYFVAVCSH